MEDLIGLIVLGLVGLVCLFFATKFWEKRMSEKLEKLRESNEFHLQDLREMIEKRFDSLSEEALVTKEHFEHDLQQTKEEFHRDISLLNIDSLRTGVIGLEVHSRKADKAHRAVINHIVGIEKAFEKRISGEVENLTKDFKNQHSQLQGELKKYQKNFKDELLELSRLTQDFREEYDKALGLVEARLDDCEENASQSKSELLLVQENLKSVDASHSKKAESLEAFVVGFKKESKDLRLENIKAISGISDHIAEIQDNANKVSKSLDESNKSLNSLKTTGNKRYKDLGNDIKKLSEGARKELKSLIVKLELLDGKTEKLESIYEVEFKSEKERLSKALLLGRASLSGFQLLFKGKYEADKINDIKTVNRLRRYENSVNKFGFLNDHIYQRFNRHLNTESIEKLIFEWEDKLGVVLTEAKLAYLASKVWVIEGNCVGRLATNVEDEIIRCLLAAYVGENGFRGVEIGALFGINICCIKELSSAFCDSFHLTVIDPLEGYYAQQPNDILVDEPINEDVFWRNVTRYCLKKEIRLIKDFTYNLTGRNFGKNTYNYVLIDGDHTYEGVKVDFDLIKDYVEVGGFILFDDYGTEDWPDVKRFVDEVILPDDDYKEIICMFRTCVIQKLR